MEEKKRLGKELKQQARNEKQASRIRSNRGRNRGSASGIRVQSKKTKKFVCLLEHRSWNFALELTYQRMTVARIL